MADTTILRLPHLKRRLSQYERDALDELIPVAEDFAMHGDDRATEALAWMRSISEQGD